MDTCGHHLLTVVVEVEELIRRSYWILILSNKSGRRVHQLRAHKRRAHEPSTIHSRLNLTLTFNSLPQL
jgi:hypothetical protein